MKDLDFGRIDLITENCKLKLELLKLDITKNERTVIKYRRKLSLEQPNLSQALTGLQDLALDQARGYAAARNAAGANGLGSRLGQAYL